MATKKLFITYYTGTGSTKRMAEEIGKGAERLGVKVEVKSVEKCMGAVEINPSNVPSCCSLIWAESVAAGAHTIKVQWKRDSGTASCAKATYPDFFHRILRVVALKR